MASTPSEAKKFQSASLRAGSANTRKPSERAAARLLLFGGTEEVQLTADNASARGDAGRQKLFHGSITRQPKNRSNLGPGEAEGDSFVDDGHRQSRDRRDLLRSQQLQTRKIELARNLRGLLRREIEQGGRERIEDHLIGHPGVAHFVHCRRYQRLFEFVVRITMRREGLQLDNQDAAQV